MVQIRRILISLFKQMLTDEATRLFQLKNKKKLARLKLRYKKKRLKRKLRRLRANKFRNEILRKTPTCTFAYQGHLLHNAQNAIKVIRPQNR